MRVTPLVRWSSANLPTRCGHDHARRLRLDARRIAHPGGMDVCDELVLGHGMGSHRSSLPRSRHGPIGAAAQVTGRVALEAPADLAKDELTRQAAT